MDLQNVKQYILKVWRLWSLLHGEFKHDARLVSLKSSLWCEERAGSVVSFCDVPENTRQGKQRWGTCSPVWLCWRCFFKFQRDFTNMTWGPLSPTHFLSHDIMGWYWQAPSSCVMLWDFTGSQRRLNTNAALTVAPYVSDSKQLRNHPSDPHQWKKKKYPDETNSGEVSQLTSDCHVSPTDPGTSASEPNTLTVSEKYKHN